uniref:GOLD domain-containing protein n=1 Tax=Parastrongyloides trichosuri TaxID=131310 RepID=A0A0N4ZIN1_PARTI
MFHYKDKLRLFIYNVKRNFTFITIADEDHVSYNLHIYITTSFSEENNDVIINVDDGKYEVDLYPHIDIKCIQRFSSGKNKKFGFQYDIYPRNDSLPDEQNAIIGFSLLHYIIMHKIVYGEYKCLYGKDQHIKIELVSTNGYINQFNKPTRTIVELYEPPEVSLILFITVLALSGAMIIFSRNIFLDRTKYRIT